MRLPPKDTPGVAVGTMGRMRRAGPVPLLRLRCSSPSWPRTGAGPRIRHRSSWCSRSRGRSTGRCSTTSTTGCVGPSATARSWCCSSTRSGTLDQDGVALADRGRGPRRAGHRVGGSGAGPKASGAGLLLMYASSLAGGRARARRRDRCTRSTWLHPEDRPPDLDTRRSKGGSMLGARTPTLDCARRGRCTAAEAIDLGIATEAAYVGPGAPRRIDGQTVQTPRGPVTLADAHRDHRAEAKRGHGRRPVRQPRADPAGAPRRGDAVDGLLPARDRARGARLRTHPAGVRLRGVRGRRDAGAWPRTGSRSRRRAWVGMALLLGGIGLMTLDVRLRKLGRLHVRSGGGIRRWVGPRVERDVGHAIAISPWLIGGAVVASTPLLRVRADRGDPVA